MTATNFTAGEAVSHVYPAQVTVFNRVSNYLSSLSITMNTKNTEETAGGGQEHEYNSRNLGDDVDADDGSRHLRERDNGGQEHEYESGHPDNMDVDDDGGYLHERDNGDPSDSVSLTFAS